MADPQPQRREGLTDAELSAEQGSELPEREAMSMLHIMPVDTFALDHIDNLSLPINQAIALNVNTNESIANAEASQVVIGNQADTPSADGANS